MEFKKTEKKIKETLEERRIQPTEEVWKKLEEQLDEGSSFRWRNGLKYAAVALLLLGVGILGGYLFSIDFSSSESVVKTKTEIKSTEGSENAIVKDKSPNFDRITHSEDSQNADEISDNQSIINPIAIGKKDTASIPKISSEDLDVAASELAETDPQDTLDKEAIDLLANQLFEEAQSKITHADDQDEADRLLEEAMQRESHEEVIDSTIFFAQVEDLLDEVTRELDREEDRNFRDKVYAFIKDRWEKAKTGLAGEFSK